LTLLVAFCYKAAMRPCRFLSLLLAFLVLFASFPDGMALASGAKDRADSHTLSAACHESMTTDAGASIPHHGHDAGSSLHGQHDAPMAAQAQHDDCSSAASHDCFNTGCASVAGCSGFAGMLSLASFSPALPGAQEAIPFRASLRLDARVTGIYHPPRQHA
jgi:hypothetical protein